ncbi:MAG: DCC1-like thiol-disulfide oxidoreductase family protein [Dermatophilaceae bacterium]
MRSAPTPVPRTPDPRPGPDPFPGEADGVAPRPVLVFDGDCGVCTRFARLSTRLRRRSADYAVAPWQTLDLTTLGLTPQQCDAAVQWVAGDGSVSSSQDAIARSLLAARAPVRPLGALILAPGVNTLAGVVYRWVAANRSRLPGGTPACSLPPAQRPR